MKFEYISPIIEMIDIDNDEQILAGSLKATDGFGNDPDDITVTPNPDEDYGMGDIEGDPSNLSKGGMLEW